MKMNAKKIIRILAVLMFTVCTIFALSSCEALDGILGKIPGLPGKEPPAEECTHTMKETAAKAATCTEAGNTQYFTCSACNKVFKDKDGTTETTLEETVVVAKGHKEANIAAVAPTCTATGLTEGKKCSVCNQVLTPQQTVAVTAHTLENMAGKAATCEEEGYTAYKACSNCDYIEGKEVVEKAAHTEEIDEGFAPTCITHGYSDGSHCSVCFEVIVGQEEIPALGHATVTDAAVAPTCTETGLTEGSHCSRCDEVFVAQETVNALGHDMDEGTYTITPNCTEGGEIKYTCKRDCGHTTTEEVGPKHDIVTVPGKEATCYEDGYTAAESCTLCDYTKESVVIPGGHKGEWAPVDKESEMFVCESCGRIQKRERNDIIADVEFPAETSGTRIDFTDALHAISADDDGGKYLVLDFDILIDKSAVSGTTEYLFTLKVMDAGISAGLSGNAPGLIQFTMKNSSVIIGGVTPETPITPMGETYYTFRVVVELAVDKNAAGKYVSKYHVYAKETGAAGPMELVKTITVEGDYGNVARYDNYKIVLHKEAKASYVLDVANVSFIRTNDTNYLYTGCNHVFTEWEILSEAVACTTDGVAKRTCTVDGCGYVDVEYISAHKLTTVEALAPTCTENGYHISWVCSDCQKVIGKVEIPAIGHDMTDWVEIEDGAKLKKTCQNGCGYYELRVVTENAPITFDDGTITAGGKVHYTSADITVAGDNKSAVDAWEYTKWSIADKDGVTALCVAMDIKKGASGHGRQFTFDTTDGSTEGNVYTFDFDLYIEPGADATNNSSRVALPVYFGGASYSLGTYGAIVRRYATSLNFGSTKTWISFRFVYTVVENGKANLEVSVKNASGNYKVVDAIAVSASSIKLDGVSAIGFDTYTGPGSFTSYVTNVSLTRHTSGYEAE